LLRTSGIEIDEILAQELTRPGADPRHGVTLIARPSPAAAGEIKRIQALLQKFEPQQYYYPCPDLHTTILEISYGKTPAETLHIVENLRAELSSIIQDLPTALLEAFCLGFDPKGCALNFIPQNHQLQQLRDLLRKRVAEAGINLQSRYPLTAAHVSLLRYVKPIAVEKNQWADQLRDIAVNPEIRWKISELYLTWGTNWYGKCTQDSSIGSVFLQD
jgi:hypothetical protein